MMNNTGTGTLLSFSLKQDGADSLWESGSHLVHSLEHQLWIVLEERLGITHLHLTMDDINRM